MFRRFLEKFFPESGVTNFWQDEQKKAYVFLPLWIIFILWVIFGFVVPYQNSLNDDTPSSETEPSDENTLDDMWLALFNDNYEFTYSYTDATISYSYEGMSKEDKVSGTKKEGNVTTQFYIDGTYIYTVEDGKLVFHSISDFLLYEDYFMIDNIYELIHDVEPFIRDGKYEFEKDGKYVTIETTEDNIESISLSDSDKTYILQFWNINGVESIEY